MTIFSEIAPLIPTETLVKHLNSFLWTTAWQEDSPLLALHLVNFCAYFDRAVLFNKLLLDIVDHKKDIDETMMRVDFYLRFLEEFSTSETFSGQEGKTFI
jgi:hypothetical protein